MRRHLNKIGFVTLFISATPFGISTKFARLSRLLKNPLAAGRIASVALAVLLANILGCSSQKPAPASSPRYGGTLNWAVTAEMEQLDPQRIMFRSDWQVASLIYEGLLTIGKDHNQLIPRLAENWEKLDGGRRLIFHLRHDVCFHDDPCFPDGVGREFQARDVVYTFQRIADPDVASPNWYLFKDKIEGIEAYHERTAPDISGIRALDDSTVEIKLTRPYYSFLKLLATPTAFIVPQEAVAHYGADFSHHPVGAGPFRLVHWRRLADISLVKNDRAWEKDEVGRPLPYLDGLHIRLISNPMLSVSEFLKGSLDLLAVNEKQFAQLGQEAGFEQKFIVAQKDDDFSVRFFGISMNGGSVIARRPEIRRAIACAFDNRALAQQFPIDIPKGLVPSFLLGSASPKWYAHDPAAAKKMIDNLDTNVTKSPIYLCSNISGEAVNLLSKAMLRIGLTCRVDIHAMRYYEHIMHKRPEIFRVSFYPSYPDPEEYYALFYSKSSPSVNLTGYCNPQFDALLEQAFVEQDAGKRQSIFLRLEKLLKRDVPAIYISHSRPKYFITPKNIHGLSIQSTIPDFRKVWIESQDAEQK